MLRTRVLTAAALLAIFIAAAFGLKPKYFDGLLLLVVSLASFEWLKLVGARQAIAAALAALMLIAGVLGLEYSPSLQRAMAGDGAGLLPIYGFAAVFWLIGVPAALKWHAPIGSRRLAGQVLAWVIPWATWLGLVQAHGLGKGFLLSVLLLVWTADSAAYFAGRAFGRRKLAALVSPGKTWEGVAGAMAATILLAAMLASFGLGGQTQGSNLFGFLLDSLGWFGLFGVVVLLTIASVLGDLYESLLKRAAQVKDSGRLLPGHGGVFDRVDALIAVFPVTMLVVTIVQL